MKTSIRTYLFCIILLLLCWTNISAQYDLGPNGLLDAPAPTLRDPGHISLGKPGYVGKIGGIAFDAVASPAAGLDFMDLKLIYRSREKDGNRLWIVVGKQEFPVRIHDWQLIPIAKYADSPYKSCITLFGELDNREESKRIRKSGGRIINYHPAFVNTLLGLRLFQFDILILDRAAIELPSQNGKYILGAGESPPEVEANARAWDSITELLHRLRPESDTYRSYVITEQAHDIHFSFNDSGLNLTGQPYFYFWQYKRNFRDYDADSTYKKIADEVDREAQSLMDLSNRNPEVEREAYVKVLLSQLRESERYYAEGYYENTSPPRYVSDLIKMKGDEERRKYVKDDTTDFIREMILRLRYFADAYTVVPLSQFSMRISAETDTLRSINPAVWDAGANVMRYAAFFRYYKRKYPSQWKDFLVQLSQVTVTPQVRTPTIMKVPK